MSSQSEITGVALKFVGASLLSSGGALNEPNMTVDAVNASQLTRVTLRLGRIVTYFENGTLTSPLLVQVSSLANLWSSCTVIYPVS